MRVKRVKPHEVPLHLLQQKKQWDLFVYYDIAAVAEDWYCYVLEDDGIDVAAAILVDTPLCRAVTCQTFIVDKQHRTQERVAEAAKKFREIGIELAHSLGRQYLTASVIDGERFLDYFGRPENARIVEHVLLEEV